MMNCKQATQLLSEKLDRPLTSKEKIALKMHVLMCPACRKFGKQMEEIRIISKCYTSKDTPKENK